MPVQVAIENALVAIEEAVYSLPRVSAAKIGLDVRAGYVYVDVEEQCIVVEGSSGSLDYYGGFEYVPEENTTSIGQFKVYMAEGLTGEYCERVVDAIDSFIENEEAA